MNFLTPVRFKTYTEVIKQCKRQKVPYVGGDLIVRVGGWGHGVGFACYDVNTGYFWGRAPSGILFNSRARRHDRYDWMKALRAFFHEEIKA